MHAGYMRGEQSLVPHNIFRTSDAAGRLCKCLESKSDKHAATERRAELGSGQQLS